MLVQRRDTKIVTLRKRESGGAKVTLVIRRVIIKRIQKRSFCKRLHDCHPLDDHGN